METPKILDWRTYGGGRKKKIWRTQYTTARHLKENGKVTLG